MQARIVLCNIPLFTLPWSSAARTKITLTFILLFSIHFFLLVFLCVETIEGNIAFTDCLRSTNKVQDIWDLNANRKHCSGRGFNRLNWNICDRSSEILTLITECVTLALELHTDFHMVHVSVHTHTNTLHMWSSCIHQVHKHAEQKYQRFCFQVCVLLHPYKNTEMIKQCVTQRMANE